MQRAGTKTSQCLGGKMSDWGIVEWEIFWFMVVMALDLLVHFLSRRRKTKDSFVVKSGRRLPPSI